MEPKISEILLKYDTDKNNGTVGKCGHHYGDSYNEILARFDREKGLSLLEIGVQKGGSLKAWREYFPNAKVIGVDIVDVRKSDYCSPYLEFIRSDIKQIDALKRFGANGLDIVVDDGSHILEDVLFVVDKYLEVLNYNGILVIEDVQNPEMWIKEVLRVVKAKRNCYRIDYKDMRNVGGYDDFLITIQKILPDNRVRRFDLNGYYNSLKSNFLKTPWPLAVAALSNVIRSLAKLVIRFFAKPRG